MMASSRAWRVIALSWADFCHDWRVAVCQVLALAAVMTPLLVLLGLKTGIVETLKNRLLHDPRNLEVVLVGSYRLAPEWFDDLKALPETGFLVPRTRSLSATLDVRAAAGRLIEGVELVPGGNGDPLFPAALPAPLGLDHVVLTRAAAERLGVGAGESIIGLLTRTVSGSRQVLRIPLVVMAILPEQSLARPAAFVDLAFLVAAEEWRDGRRDDLVASQDTGNRLFASARLFARTLDDVAVLAARLREEGIEVRTRGAEIEMVRAVDRVLTSIFTVLAFLATGGFILSMAAGLWADVERRSRDLALLRLVGFGGCTVALFPVVRAVLVAVGGILVSCGLYLLVAALFDRTLSTNLSGQGFVCYLDPWTMVLSAALTLVLAAASSAVAALRAVTLEPGEILRNV